MRTHAHRRTPLLSITRSLRNLCAVSPSASFALDQHLPHQTCLGEGFVGQSDNLSQKESLMENITVLEICPPNPPLKSKASYNARIVFDLARAATYKYNYFNTYLFTRRHAVPIKLSKTPFFF